jgi:hypothetical protein
MPKFKFESHKLTEILAEYAQIREVEIPRAVLINARLLAKELARRTQPFGTRPDAGLQRVKNDIGKVIKTDDHLDDMINRVTTDSLRTQLKKLLLARNYEAIREIFERIGFLRKYSGMQIVSDFREPHKKNRNTRTGRTFKKADELYISSGNLDSYISEIQKRVGISKAGWAVAAEALPSTVANKRSAYDFPKFVKDNISQASGSAIDNTSNLSNPTVTLTNSVPWVDRVCTTTDQTQAQSVVIARMKKQMAEILKKRRKAEETAD